MSTNPFAMGRLHHLAFHHSLQSIIITEARTGNIITANTAVSNLLGYSKKQILDIDISKIFDIHESGFKTMLQESVTKGRTKALVTAIRKNGEPVPCEITSAVFMDEDGVEKAVLTISDLDLVAKKQRMMGSYREKAVNGIFGVKQVPAAALAEDNKRIDLVEKASYDVMWDWDIPTSKIYVGDSIEEVFGYKLQSNVIDFSDFINCLMPEERRLVEKKLMKILASRNKTWSDSFKCMRQDNSIAYTTSRASIVRNEKGKAIRMIGAIQDVSLLQELESKLEKKLDEQIVQEHQHFLSERMSFDVIWDWNLLTDEVYIGEDFEELFGYVIKNNKGNITDKRNYIHPHDKEGFEKGLQKAIASSEAHWTYEYRFTRANGTVANVFEKASIIRDTHGKAYRMIGAMQDISQEKEFKEKLHLQIASKEKLFTEYRDRFKLIFNSSYELLYDIDLVANDVVISDAFEKEFGYKRSSKMTPEEDWISHIHPDDKEAVLKDYSRMLVSDDTEWKYSYRFFRADGSVADIISSGVILRNPAGKACRMIISMHDISKQKALEERLHLEIMLKERQIAEAMERAKESERSVLGQELHDNINQLLGASRLYLDLAKLGGENKEMYLSRSSEYTLNAIDEIRRLSKGLTTHMIKNLGLCEAIENISRDTMEVNAIKILFTHHDVNEASLTDNFKLNIFRIVQEQLNNILKHAKAKKVEIKLLQNAETFKLIICDNGVGFDTLKKQKGIGLDNIKDRANSYNGAAVFLSRPGKGCILTVTLPLAMPLLNEAGHIV